MSETSIATLVAHLPSSNQTVPALNPANGKKIFDLPQLSTQQVVAAFAKAREAQVNWAKTPVSERAKLLNELHKLMLADEEKLLDLLQLETAKARAHAFEETVGAIAAAKYYSRIATKALTRKPTRAGIPLLTKTYVDHAPLGVVGVITPWNYPLALTMLDVLPALVAGNAVVQKADNQTALTVLFARHLAVEAGIPAELWTVVVGDGEQVGNAIVIMGVHERRVLRKPREPPALGRDHLAIRVHRFIGGHIVHQPLGLVDNLGHHIQGADKFVAVHGQ